MASLTGTQHVKGFPASHRITLHRIGDRLSTPVWTIPLTEKPVIGMLCFVSRGESRHSIPGQRPRLWRYTDAGNTILEAYSVYQVLHGFMTRSSNASSHPQILCRAWVAFSSHAGVELKHGKM
ncbi:hypothetical protein NXS19_010540 [Fusarium pseudograminearum]|nr:hypothetical protein NXS19_010540 [Fusarium pseudograminearum]